MQWSSTKVCISAIRNAIGVATIPIVFCGVLILFYRHQAAWQSFSDLAFHHMLILISLTIVSTLFMAYSQHAIFVRLGLRQTIREWLGLGVVSSFYNLFLPVKGGSLFRSFYLKEKYGFSYGRFAAYLANFTIGTIVVSCGFASISLLGLTNELGGRTVAALCACFLSGGGTVLFLHRQITVVILRRRGAATPSQSEMLAVNGQMVLAMASFISIRAIALCACFDAIGAPVSLATCFLVFPVLMIANLFALLPGNIGIHEAIAASVISLLGHSPVMALLASLLDRGVNVIVVGFMGACFAPFLNQGDSS